MARQEGDAYPDPNKARSGRCKTRVLVCAVLLFIYFSSFITVVSASGDQLPDPSGDQLPDPSGDQLPDPSGDQLPDPTCPPELSLVDISMANCQQEALL
ncbi:MAG: hypothetical protein AYK19_07990 [Theionarchaea archaeon DG-70-1]|nr:MAG: hypothetical protein AYK19_07990 [Theionarchaea archaeon DG-70-1]